jgi:hypothetical protein
MCGTQPAPDAILCAGDDLAIAAGRLTPARRAGPFKRRSAAAGAGRRL